MKNLSYIILTLLTLISTSCRDDLDYLGGNISDETTVVRMALDFTPASEGLTRATYDGDAISDIEDLCLVIFDTAGNFHSFMEVDLNKADVSVVDRVDADASNGHLAGEAKTSRVSVDLDLPLGSYYIHALSNIRKYDTNGNITQTTRQYLEEIFPSGTTNPKTRAEFCALRRSWDTNSIRGNSELTGYVVNADKEGKSPSPSTLYGEDEKGNVKLPGTPVTVTKGLNVLHGWLRRMASKVTVTFDASQLSDNISVYIHDIRLHDIVKSAPLLTYGKADSADDLVPENDDDNSDKQVLAYCPESDLGAKVEEWNDLKDRWPVLTRANWSFDAKDAKDDTYNFPHLKKMTHSNSAYSLYFYENMQGEGESKLQDAEGPKLDEDGNPVLDENGNVIIESIPDGKVDSPNSYIPGQPHYKDNKPYGTYVEVRGYYVNRIKGEESHGYIVYRFMLGKDKVHNYDCERNFHYKLTLQLKGRANDVDWHIEYVNENEEIYIPTPYYISYGYNESLSLPIKVKGHITQIKSTIIKNNWFPNHLWEIENIPTEWQSQAAHIPENYKGNIGDTDVPKITALGFLTLYQPNTDAIGIGKAWTDEAKNKAGGDNPYLLRYWRGDAGIGRGYALYTRTYKLPDNNGALITESDKGSWSFERQTIDGQEYTQAYLPLYTRERNLMKTIGYTGQNPFIAYQRSAKVRYEITYVNALKQTKTVTKEVDIIQVARVANPTAIWRSWNNTRPFHVSINLIDGDDNDTFHTLESRGGWSAQVTVGADWILLNGGRQKIWGANGSKIEFDLRPASTLSSEKESRYAIIEIKYHDYSCNHKIFVKQGYAPTQVNAGDTYWHNFNVVDKSTLAEAPLDEGSMFRFGNWDDAISSSNNYNDKNPWIYVKIGDFKSGADKDFSIAGSSVTKKWSNISSIGHNSKFMSNNSVTVSHPGTSTTDARMMTREDIQKLRDNPDNAFAYGILYGDEATTTLFNINEVFGFRGYLGHLQYGMRGCLVYNQKTGAQIFFPIGASGYGRRINNNIQPAVLKYAGANHEYSALASSDGYIRETMMLFLTLYKSYGAVYWCYEKSDATFVPGHEDSDKLAGGLDVNYFSFDFNPIGSDNLNNASGTNLSDACFIRLVQDKP